jgi:hypothetical protein
VNNLINKKLAGNRTWKNIFSLFFVLSVFFISSKAEAANLFFSPAIGNVYVGDTFTVNVLVDTQNVAINSVETTIDFPEDYLDVVSLSESKSIFSMWVQTPAASSTDGDIYFTGGLPTPGYSGANGEIMSITFRAKKSGVAVISYSGSSVRANDGLGTDVFQNGGNGEYTISEKSSPTVEVPTENENIATFSPVISSPSHPDSNAWYSNNNPQFTWTFPDEFNGVEVSYDENPVATPNMFYATTSAEKDFTDLRDGVYYLHLQVRSDGVWSKVSNFKFQIDTERPLNFDITELNKNETTKTQAEFTFNASDTLSGLDHFEISIDDSVPTLDTDVSNLYYKTPVLSSGKHIIVIKAYDKAGNYVPSSAMFFTGISAIPSSAQGIISTMENFAVQTYDWLIELLKELIAEANVFLTGSLGSAIVKTISALGLIAAIAIPALVFMISTSLRDMWLMLVGFLMDAIGFRRKNRAWGTVYDSVTKRPLDLVHVLLIDLETSKIVDSSITDKYGEYRFLTLPGRYGIETRKTKYLSPSEKMKGQSFDKVYDNLYFGEEIIIRSRDEIVVKNIPMDSEVFNWNEFVKERMNGGIFIRTKILRWFSNMLFILGAISAILAAIFIPIFYNIVILGIYLLVCMLYLIFKGPKLGEIVENGTNLPMSFAIINIFRLGEDNPIVKKVADEFGKYFAQVPGGKYYLIIDKKNNNESYTEVLHTTDIEIKDGVINFDIKI